jgi:hypothetical protein
MREGQRKPSKFGGKSKEVIPEAEKVKGHMREGQRKPMDVPVKFQESQEP